MSLRQNKIPVRNPDLHKETWGTGNGNYVGKYKYFFFSLNTSKYNQLFKVKTTKYCELCSMSGNKMSVTVV